MECHSMWREGLPSLYSCCSECLEGLTAHASTLRGGGLRNWSLDALAVASFGRRKICSLPSECSPVGKRGSIVGGERLCDVLAPILVTCQEGPGGRLCVCRLPFMLLT